MRGLILLLFAAIAALAQPQPAQTFIKGNPPGGIGAACNPAQQVGYLDSSGHAITCPISTNLWTVLAAGGGGGATIPNTTNLIKGDGAGNGANTKVAITSPATAATIQFSADNETVILPAGTMVPNSITVNGHALSSNVTVTNADLGAVPTSTTVNGHALSSNVTVTNSDLGAVPTTTTVNGHALSSNVTVTNADLGAVPTTTTVNGHALSSNVTVTASDIGAVTSVTGTANQVASTGGATPVLSLPSNLILPSATVATTQSQADGSTKVATTAYVDTGLGGKAASNASTTVNSQTCALGSTCTVTAAPNAAINLAASGAGGVTGIAPEANGGTGANNTAGAAGHVLRSNATHYVDSAIQAGDVPTTLTSGTAITNAALTTPTLGTPASGVATNLTGTATGLTSGITNALKSASTTVDVSASVAPAQGQTLVANDSTHATWQTANSVNARVYGAKGTARSSATGSCTSGSATLTDPGAPFLSTDPGNLIAIAGAGPGSNNTLLSTNAGQGTGTVSSAASSGGKIQITFAAGTVGQGSTLATGNRIYLSNATGGLAVGEFYAGSVTATTAILFTDPALTVGTTFTSTGTGNINWGNIDLETTISSFTNASTVTLATTCGTTVSSVTYRQGVDDGPSIASAIAAAAAAPGAQVYIPRGNYMIGSTATAAAPTVPTFANCAVFSSGNGITIYGDGRGETYIWSHHWRSPIMCLTGTDVRLSAMTIQPAIPVGQRDSNQIASHGVLMDTLNSITATRVTINDVEVGNTAQGITIGDGCTVCVGMNSYVHDDLANAFLMVTTNGTVSESGFINTYAENSRDAGYSFDSQTSGTAPLTDTFCINCRIRAGGASGMEITGATRMKISGFHSSSTFGPGIRILGTAGYTDTNDVQIVDAQIEGAGTGAVFAGQTNFEPQACLWVGAKSTGINIKNTQIGLLKCDGIGASKTLGPYLGAFITGSSTIVGLSVGVVDGSGGNTNVTQQDSSKFPRNAGIELYGVQDFSLGKAYLRSTYEDGLFIDSTSTGSCTVNGLTVNAPNTSSTASVYAYNVQGCTRPTYQNVATSNVGTLAATINCLNCFCPPVARITDVWSNGVAGAQPNGGATEHAFLASCAVPAAATANTIDGRYSSLAVAVGLEAFGTNTSTLTFAMKACPTANFSQGSTPPCSSGGSTLWAGSVQAVSSGAQIELSGFHITATSTAGTFIVHRDYRNTQAFLNPTALSTVTCSACTSGAWTLYFSATWSAQVTATAACVGTSTTGAQCVAISQAVWDFKPTGIQ